jgi:hypothetical protein
MAFSEALQGETGGRGAQGRCRQRFGVGRQQVACQKNPLPGFGQGWRGVATSGKTTLHRHGVAGACGMRKWPAMRAATRFFDGMGRIGFAGFYSLKIPKNDLKINVKNHVKKIFIAGWLWKVEGGVTQQCYRLKFLNI